MESLHPAETRTQGARPLVVGVDVGGTKIAAALVDAEGHTYGRVCHPTDVTSPEATLSCIADAIVDAISASGYSKDDVLAVGLGIPGKVDPRRGIGILSVNLGWRDVPVRATLEATLNLPCMMENDVKAATLGESRYGAGRGMRNMVYLSVGTGIAAGIIIDGKLYRGTTGMAGEIGHAVIDRRGRRCKCGARGCLEAVAAGPAMAARALAAIRDGRQSMLSELTVDGQDQLTAEMVFEAAAAGDSLAVEIVGGVGTYLGRAINLLIMSFDPQLIVLGGGVAQGGALLLDAVRRELIRQATESFVFQAMFNPEAVQLTALGSDVGILGAAALVAPQRAHCAGGW